STNGTPAVDDFAVRMSASRARVAALRTRAAAEGRAAVNGRTDDTAHKPHSAAAPTLIANVALVAWPTMAEAAYYGVAGDIVNTIKPHTEADPVAVLIQLLTCAGNIIGNCPYYQIEGTRHHANLFSILVGRSSKARKGAALDRISSIIRVADDRWYSER